MDLSLAYCKLLKKDNNNSFPCFEPTRKKDEVNDVSYDNDNDDSECRSQFDSDKFVQGKVPGVVTPFHGLGFMKTITNENCQSLTGLNNLTTFWQLYNFLECDKFAVSMMYWDQDTGKNVTRNVLYNKRKLNNSISIGVQDELVIVLMKLKLNATDDELASRLNCSKFIIQSIFATWILFIFNRLVTFKCLPRWPPRHKVDSQMPSVFGYDPQFKQLRAIKLKFDFLGEKPHNLFYETDPFCFTSLQTSQVWSMAIMITPNGAVSYMSPLFNNSQTESFWLNASEHAFKTVQSTLVKNDIVIGPKINQSVLKCYEDIGVNYMTVENNNGVADSVFVKNVRSLTLKYVERLLSYRILSCLPNSCQSIFEQIVKVCVLLTNLNDPILCKTDSVLQ